MTAARLAALLAGLAGAAGCMRIYPDPELPDVIAEWTDECGPDGVTVRIEAVATDGTVVTQDAPCADGEVRVEDLDRTWHTITAVLLDAGDVVLGRAPPAEVDLRAGLSRRAFLWQFARSEGFYRVAWTFAGGDTCASLGVDNVMIDLRNDETISSAGGWCAAGKLDYFVPVQAGTYTVQAFAVRTTDFVTIAASEPRADVVIPDRGVVVDLGTIALARCTESCGPPPPEGPPGDGR
ncbi:MAG TPA: hypothetical protein VM734_04295 [Kofleriaceae bacterium]|jgi:hypothetical protein|nr:hypothetical protein [Kofleriaceae bacterium]